MIFLSLGGDHPITTRETDPNVNVSQCDTLNRNYTRFHHARYGIPVTLATNIVGACALVLIFSVLRRKAGDYARLTLQHHTWAAMFCQNRADGLNNNVLEQDPAFDRGLFSWIPATLLLSDEQFRTKIGPDSVQYLYFQRYLIFLMLVLTVCSLTVLLPVNIYASGILSPPQNVGNDSLPRQFGLGDTTLASLNVHSPLQWVPTCFCILYMVIVFLSMYHFKRHMPYKEQLTSNALIISNLKLDRKYDGSVRCVIEDRHIEEFFKKTYPYKVCDVRLAYDVKKLEHYQRRMDESKLALDYCIQYNAKSPQNLTLSPGGCWLLQCWNRVDAASYYQKRFDHYQAKVEGQINNLVPLGICFVQFESPAIAQRIAADFKTWRKLKGQWPTGFTNSSMRIDAEALGVDFWNVKHAPAYDNIVWNNLGIVGPEQYLRGFFVNVIYVVLFFFVTSPAVLLAWFDWIDDATTGIRRFAAKSSLLSFVVPPLLFVTFAVLMPYLVFVITELRGYWRVTRLNQQVMTKTTIYLIFMIIILPSIGLTSLYTLVDYMLNNSYKGIRWHCIFLADNGAFFINYTITASLCGLAMELLRLIDLLLYLFRLLIMRSKAETKAAIKNTLLEFPYGFMYAYQLTVVSVAIVYSVSCPVITPCGLLYTLLRHFVDRYNIYFSYAPSRIGRDCHNQAVFFVTFASLLMLFIQLTFYVIRLKFHSPHIWTLLVVVIGTVLWLISNKLFACVVRIHNLTRSREKLDLEYRQSKEDPSQEPSQEPSSTGANAGSGDSSDKYRPHHIFESPLLSYTRGLLSQKLQPLESIEV